MTNQADLVLARGLITIEQAAARFGCSGATVRRMVANGTLRSRRGQGRVVIVEQDVERQTRRRKAPVTQGT